jgi:putative tributyrin esterase
MALIQCDFFSETLKLSMSMNVILPQQTTKQIGMEGKTRQGKHPTLYLLHGMSDDHTIWLRRTSIERYVAPLGLAVVMPAVHRSRYANMACGGDYWTYVSEEVPRLAREFFNLSDKREDNFVAGLSMGGYGAFKMGLRCADKFCAAASLSGGFRRTWPKDMPEESRRQAEWVHGDLDAFPGSFGDLYQGVTDLVDSGAPKPKLFQCCGTEDFLYDANTEFKGFVEDKGFDYTYEEEPGTHEWGYWDTKIQRVLEWLPLK